MNSVTMKTRPETEATRGDTPISHQIEVQPTEQMETGNGQEVTRKRRSDPKNARGQGLSKNAKVTTKVGKLHRRGNKKKSAQKSANCNKNTRTSAPLNTTQFIMADHGDTIQYLNHILGGKRHDDDDDDDDDDLSISMPKRYMRRATESGFSLDSNDELHYSSLRDEGDFLNREFLKEYDDAKSERLIALPKGELINEYLQMESRVEMLEKRVEISRKKYNRRRHQNGEDGPQPNEVPLDQEYANKIQVFQQEIRLLLQENQKLRRENFEFKRELGSNGNSRGNQDQEDSDTCSTCSSSCSSSCSTCSESDGEGEHFVAEPVNDIIDNLDENAQDTGYESGHSNGNKKASEEVVTSTSN